MPASAGERSRPTGIERILIGFERNGRAAPR
jgi:hypothetical protein